MYRVLLVDSGDRRDTVRDVLENAGIEVEEPESVEAVRQIDTTRYRCLLATVGPLFGTADDAIDLAGRLPVVLLDPVGDARLAVAAMKRGAAEYLISPFTGEELVNAVGRCAPAAGALCPERREVGDEDERGRRLDVRTFEKESPAINVCFVGIRKRCALHKAQTYFNRR